MMKTKSAQQLLKEKLKNRSFAKAYQEVGYLMEIGVSIASAREKTGLSQGQLAQKLKTTQSVISRIENGNQNLSVKMLVRIAHILRYEVHFKMFPLKMAA